MGSRWVKERLHTFTDGSVAMVTRSDAATFPVIKVMAKRDDYTRRQLAHAVALVLEAGEFPVPMWDAGEEGFNVFYYTATRIAANVRQRKRAEQKLDD